MKNRIALDWLAARLNAAKPHNHQMLQPVTPFGAVVEHPDMETPSIAVAAEGEQVEERNVKERSSLLSYSTK